MFVVPYATEGRRTPGDVLGCSEPEIFSPSENFFYEITISLLCCVWSALFSIAASDADIPPLAPAVWSGPR